MARFVIGDIHGRSVALKTVLKDSNFDYDNDKLIILGDVVDGGEDTYNVIEELLKIKNLVYIKGNHDEMFLDFVESGYAIYGWTHQGGLNTINSYLINQGKEPLHRRKSHDWMYKFDHTDVQFNDFVLPVTHQDFFNRGVYYYIEDDGDEQMCFVHGGFDPHKGIENTPKQTLLWDRDLYCQSSFQELDEVKRFKKIFIGHTTTETINDNCTYPVTFGNVVMMDTGAGWSGKLSLMNIDTEEVYQSEKLKPAR